MRVHATPVTNRRSCSTSAPGCATSAPAGRPTAPSGAPRSSPTSTGTTSRACRSSSPLLRDGAHLDVYAPLAGGRAQRPRGLRRLPPPALLPGHARGTSCGDGHASTTWPTRSSRSAGPRSCPGSIPHVGPTLGYRVDVGRRVGRLPVRPPAAVGRLLPVEPRGPRAVRRRRPRHPRRAVHAERVRARRARGATARSSTRCGSPTRPAPSGWRCSTTTRCDDDTLDELAARRRSWPRASTSR